LSIIFDSRFNRSCWASMSTGAHNRIWERRAPGKMVMVGF
jgi:hypothetical protein